MTIITGYTAERMKAIEDSTVVGGEIDGDDLILLTRDNTPINAGDVRGPKGDTGEVSNAALSSALVSLVQSGTYTPAVANVTLGTGGSPTDTADYTFVGGPNVSDKGIMYINGRMILGNSGFAVSGTPHFGMPSGFRLDFPENTVNYRLGVCHMQVAGTVYVGVIYMISNASFLRFGIQVGNSNATYVAISSITSAIPATWAAANNIVYAFSAPAVRI